ncbi:hypothetical protein EVAR_8294_1 [Eumeta japonica]|uniref:Uncharacterized protein n=1 Tax=Eumeta variegata TaxID=151549 RepID=A0A4C1Y716_EUMVA|nr:hypothetical protein EVAR_8294_1 [Eumeta japonica]
MIRHFRLLLQSSSLTSGKQMVVYQLLFTVRQFSKNNSSHGFCFIKKRSDNPLRGTSLARYFDWFRLISKDPYVRLLFRFEVVAISSCFVTCYWPHIKFEAPFLESGKHGVVPSDGAHFLSVNPYVWDPPQA